MNFALSETQTEIKNLASKLFSELAGDERQKLVDQSDARFDAELWQQLAESGLLGIAVDEAHGGMGFDFESLCILIEEAGRYVAPVPVIPTLACAALPIQRWGTASQRERWLPGIVTGSTLLTAAMEGNDIVEAQKDGNDYQLTGQLTMVPLAGFAQRVLCLAQGDAGPMMLLLDPNAKGVESHAQSSTAQEPWSLLTLEGARVNAAEVLLEGHPAAQAWGTLQKIYTVANSVMAVGVCEKMMRLTAGYTSERQQFNRPIATFQAVGQRAADCFIDIECLTLCTQEAVALLNSALADDSGDPDTLEDAVSIAKIWTGDVTHRVSQSAQHLHGGIGVDRDYPLFRYCLWAKQLELVSGSSAETLEALGERIAHASA